MNPRSLCDERIEMFVIACESEAYQALNCQNFWHDLLTDGMGRGEITHVFPCEGSFAGNKVFVSLSREMSMVSQT